MDTQLVIDSAESQPTTEAAVPPPLPLPVPGDADAATRTGCLIHVRFAPNGTVTEIGERPAGAEAQQWFNYLSGHTANSYQALSGGRGLFRLPWPEVAALKLACSEDQGA